MILFFISEKQGKRFLARTRYSYVAKDDDELTLEHGNIVEVLGEVADGWWSGKLNGKTGLFPSNYVEEISEEEARVALKEKEEPSKPCEVPEVEGTI